MQGQSYLVKTVPEPYDDRNKMFLAFKACPGKPLSRLPTVRQKTADSCGQFHSDTCADTRAIAPQNRSFSLFLSWIITFGIWCRWFGCAGRSKQMRSEGILIGALPEKYEEIFNFFFF